MKNLTLSIIAVIMAFVTVSCNQASNKNEQSSSDTAVVSQEQSASQPKEDDTVAAPVVSETPSGQEAKATGKEEAKNFSIAPIVTDYLSLKNALVSDDDKAAASSGKKLLATLNKVDMKAVPADKHKKYMDIADDAKEHAEEKYRFYQMQEPGTRRRWEAGGLSELAKQNFNNTVRDLAGAGELPDVQEWVIHRNMMQGLGPLITGLK